MRRAARLAHLCGVAAFGLLAAVPTGAAESVAPELRKPCDPAAPELQPMLLGLVVNDVDTGLTTVFMRRPCGAILARAVDLFRARIRTEAAPTVRINGYEFLNFSALPGISLAVDEAAQLLRVEGEPQAFYPTVINANRRRQQRLTPPATGGFLNYGAYLVGAPDADPTWAGNIGIGAFSTWGVGLSDWLLLGEGPRRLSRLNTTWIRDFPRWVAGLRVGDLQARAAEWGSSQPVGGIQFATNFATRPGMVVTPVAVMEALTRRSAVLQLDSERFGDPDARSSPYMYGGLSTVPHGPVQVTNLPTYNNGRYEMRVRDVLGREQIVSQPYFFSLGLLRRGLHDYSYSAGMLRDGALGNRYGDWLLSADHRYGVSNWLTAELHLDAAEQQQAGGLTALLALPWAGVLGLEVASSRADRADSGEHLGVSLENRYGAFAYAARHERRSAGFAVPGGTASSLASRSVLSLAFRLPWLDSLSLGVSEVVDRDTGARRDLRVGYVFRLTRRVSLNLFAATELTGADDNWSGGLSLSLPLEALWRGRRDGGWSNRRRTQLALTGNDGSAQDTSLNLRLGTHAEIAGQAVGTSLSSRVVGDPRTSLTASVVGDVFTGLAGVTTAEAGETWTAGLSSGLVWIGSRLLPTRPVHNSFALIRLGPEFAGVRVNGRETDARGDALITPLQPYYENPVRIFAADLPHNVKASTFEYRVNPHFRSGNVIEADLRTTRDALVSIRLQAPDGELVPLPMGAEVHVDGQKTLLPVGRSGGVYATGLERVNTLWVRWRGRDCQLVVILPDEVNAQSIPQLGPLLCAGVTP